MDSFISLFLTKEEANGFNLKQAVCTVEEERYWAEHIGGNNESTERYGSINMTGGTNYDGALDTGDCNAVDMTGDVEDFGMYFKLSFTVFLGKMECLDM